MDLTPVKVEGATIHIPTGPYGFIETRTVGASTLGDCLGIARQLKEDWMKSITNCEHKYVTTQAGTSSRGAWKKETCLNCNMLRWVNADGTKSDWKLQ